MAPLRIQRRASVSFGESGGSRDARMKSKSTVNHGRGRDNLYLSPTTVWQLLTLYECATLCRSRVGRSNEKLTCRHEMGKDNGRWEVRRV